MILSDVGTFLGLLGGLPGGVAALLLCVACNLIGIQLEFSNGCSEARMRWQITLLLLHKDLIVSLAVTKAMHGLPHGIRNDFEAATTLEQWRILQLFLLLLLLLLLLALLGLATAIILATCLVLNDAEQLQALAHYEDQQ